MNDLFKDVTVEDFKDFYSRDFHGMFLPIWNDTTTYYKNDIVFYTLDPDSLQGQFYKALSENTAMTPPEHSEGQSAVWELVEGLSVYNYITDKDINKAMWQAYLNGNEDFGANEEDKICIFLHLVAFYLVMDLKNASAGLNSSYSGLVASKSVGSVSESYNFPQWIVNSPLYSIYSQNGYGMKYLSLIIPYLSTTILFSTGRTTFG